MYTNLLNDLFITGRFSELITVGQTKDAIENTLGSPLGVPDIETPDVSLYYLEIKPGLVVSISFDKKSICYEIDLALEESIQTRFYLCLDNNSESIHEHIPFEQLLNIISKLNIEWQFDPKRVYLQTVCILLSNGLRLYYSFGNKENKDFGLFSIKSILEGHEYTSLS